MTVALGLFCGEELLATIFSVPLDTTLMSHGGLVRNMRMIEGLCVAPRYRGNGVGGFMIRHADAFTSYKFGVCAHLWARELDTAPLLSTALSVDKYGYSETGIATQYSDRVKNMPWDAFVRLWTVNNAKWVSVPVTEPAVVVSTPSNRRGKHRVFYGYGGVVVVSDTERTAADGKRIYEIVWSGRLLGDGLLPARADFDFKQLADGAAAALPAGGVLFGTTSPCGGGLRDDWDGWRVGHSGYHALYIYNYMPPAFGACRIHMVRDEI
jgi:GNAT superfamily N-acetyltransferase